MSSMALVLLRPCALQERVIVCRLFILGIVPRQGAYKPSTLADSDRGPGYQQFGCWRTQSRETGLRFRQSPETGKNRELRAKTASIGKEYRLSVFHPR